MDYEKLVLKHTPLQRDFVNSEERYWRKFRVRLFFFLFLSFLKLSQLLACLLNFASSEFSWCGGAQDPVVTDLGAKVTCISFSPLEPHNFVVSASSRLTVFDGATGEVKKTLNRFRAEAYSACFRSDGKLIVAGGEDPVIQVHLRRRPLPVAKSSLCVELSIFETSLCWRILVFSLPSGV